MKIFSLMTVAGLGLAACQTTTNGTATQSAGAPAWMSIVGKTLVSGDGNFAIVLNPDGSLEGEGIKGSWTEREGKFCRTLTKPESRAGTECQIVTLSGNQATFDNQQGRITSWMVQ
ncbi:hypothetical protein [Sulfitobacter indolifex]|uniref:hypothetical protein n=1 Tax=Sulfitobacter indolifex TaxID=225422 RepID=UPI001FAD0E29|nr:hypothetical protein [Sulfitobacter indolifex]